MRWLSDPAHRRLLAFLTALGLFLSAAEAMLPRPVPFFRIGLSNLPLLLGLDFLPLPTLFLLAALKVLGQGLIGGTLFSYVGLFSLGGTMASLLAMLLVRSAGPRLVGGVGISAAGAFAGNCAQLLLARVFVFGQAAWTIAPPLLAVGVATGAALGALAELFRKGALAERLRRDAA